MDMCEISLYGGTCYIQKLFKVVWHEELVPPTWRNGLIVNTFKNRDYGHT